MNLTCEDIRAIAHGALSVSQNEEGEIVLRRFNERQMQLYETVTPEFFRKAHATSGVRLEFVTDASFVELCYHTLYASSRRFYYFDVFVDDVMMQHFGHEDVAEVKSTLRVDLPEGTHTVNSKFCIKVCLYTVCGEKGSFFYNISHYIFSADNFPCGNYCVFP